ncbi:hypothetical protein B0I35DRAFT_481094 [Stachybotrys elegans]|uniref:Uncharacterized protein n=1 Tax=Stachybotrys elegans TaxID=80388 RepID=A0A8K0SL86_9HYPO|nr:hypothetical protein B0I35DRAFT_481094 [Stachybotrys elegans]
MESSDAFPEPQREHLVRRKRLLSTDGGIFVTDRDNGLRLPEASPTLQQVLLAKNNGAVAVKEISGRNSDGDGDPEPGARLHQVWQWYPEILWCVASIFLFCSIVAVLAWRNNKPLPNWYGSLTVNTVVALLSTVCRAATIVPVSEGISQLKWNWMAQETRSLGDIEVFNQASRGPWGSLRMMLTARGHLYATVAALILTTGLVTSTFTQSAIALETRMASMDNTYNATTYRLLSTPGNLQRATDLDFEHNIRRAALWSVFLHRSGAWPSEAPLCTATECRWDDFNSLGVCLSMRNVSERLNVTTIPAALNNGAGQMMAELSSDNYLYTEENMSQRVYYEDGTALAMNITLPGARRTFGFQNGSDALDVALLHFVIIIQELDNWNATKHHALEMVWHFCVQRHSFHIKNGLWETELSRYTKILRKGGDASRSDRLYTVLSSEDGAEEFTVRWNESRFHFDFSSDFIGERTGGSKDSLVSWHIMEQLQYGLRQYPDSSSMLPAHTGARIWQNAAELGDSVATAMSSLRRQYGEQVEGKPFAPVVFIKVEWAWLSFLACQIFLSIMFLAVVILQTASLGVDVVKSCELASLFAIDYRALSSSPSDSCGVVTPGLRQELDERVKGRLRAGQAGWTLQPESEGLQTDGNGTRVSQESVREAK